MPPGIQAPVIVQFNASSVPVLQISLSSETLERTAALRLRIYRIRQRLAPIRGITLPTPAGGKYRQIMVDIDPTKLLAKGLTPMDVVNAVNAQNLTLPSGAAKIGNTQYIVRTNATPPSIKDLNDIPIKVVNGATVFVRDVGQVHDGWQVQQNIVREDGRRSVLLSIIKNGNASTLDVVSSVKDALSTIRAAAPSGMKIKELFDQSVFVSESVQGVLREMAIAAGLTAAMILLFLGSWRSTMVVMISIPLAIVTSIVVLYFLGETINTMTLGGLALAVGILVDDSTVTIENTHRLLSSSECRWPMPPFMALPASRFRPWFRRWRFAACSPRWCSSKGRPNFFHPAWRGGHLRHAGVLRHFANLDPDHHRAAVEEWQTGEPIGVSQRHLHSIAWQVRAWFRTHAGWICGASDRSAEAARHCPDRLRAHPCTRFGIILLRGSRLLSSDRRRSDTTACRTPAGTRIEATEGIFQSIEDKIREVIPQSERGIIVDNIGLPARSYNLAFSDGSTIGPNDGIILVSLQPGHAPTSDYVRQLRQILPRTFPEVIFYFQPADIVTQILNFGSPAQIDVRTVGYDRDNNLAVARSCASKLQPFPALSMRIFSRKSMLRQFMRRSTGLERHNSDSMQATSPPMSISASARHRR